MTTHYCMAKSGFCSDCWKPANKDDDEITSCVVCGKENLCDDCVHAAVCDKCERSCCKDCHFQLSCCGLVLCGGAQSCFSKHCPTMTSRSCGHYGCNFQEECLKCHPKIIKELVEAKKAAPPAALKQVATAAAKAPMKVSPPSARRPKRAVGSIYQRDEPMEESESKKAKKRTKCAMKQVLPAPLSPANKPFSSNKRPTKPNKAVRKSRKKCSFPQNLHALITEAASVAPAVVSWFERGEAFIVHDPESAKLGELLQKHFNRKFRL